MGEANGGQLLGVVLSLLSAFVIAQAGPVLVLFDETGLVRNDDMVIASIERTSYMALPNWLSF